MSTLPAPRHPRPHDLIFWSGLAADLQIRPAGALPIWMNPDWPLVVRRAPMLQAGAWMPVGVRGSGRSQRCAAYLSTIAMSTIVSPESLINVSSLAAITERNAWPALIALRHIIDRLNGFGLEWGPAGSVGFALACGAAVVGCDSDLDLLVRAPVPLTRAQIQRLHEVQSEENGCRIDIQIDTGYGGFAFSEFHRTEKSVLLKTSHGPVMSADPWSYLAEAESEP